MEDENKNIILENKDLEENILPKKLDSLPLEAETIGLVQDIIKEKDLDNIKNMTKLFQLNQSKKNMIRIIRLNNLLDKSTDHAIERFEKCPDEIPTDQILDYMKIVQDIIDKSQKYVDNINETPMIQFNQQNNVINNINVDPISKLSRESKEKALDAINQLFAQLNKEDKVADVIDAEVIADTKVVKENK